MSQNKSPIFVGVPQIDFGGLITTANTAKDGTGTVITTFTADATNGGFIQKVRFRAAGTNIATVARVFINNGSTNATAGNNILYEEITLAATTLSETSSTPTYEISLNLALPAGYKINITIGTTVAAGFYVSGVGGKY